MNRLVTGIPDYKRIYSFTIPIVLAMLSHSFVGIVDTIMVSQLGKTSLASVGLTNVVINSLIGLLGAISPAINILMSRNLEKNHKSNISQYIWGGLYISIVLGIPITIIGILFAKDILGVIGANSSIINQGTSYMKIRFLSTTLVLVQFIFSNFFKSLEKTSVTMKVTLFSNILNIAGNYLLIFGNLGFPRLGIEGAGIATLISYIASIFFYILYVYLNNLQAFFKKVNSFKKLKESIGLIIKLSIPIAIEELFSYLLVPTILMMIVARIGINAIAANEIVLNIISFVAIPHYAFSQASTTFVSKFKDTRDSKVITGTIKKILLCDYSYLLIVSMVFFIARKSIVSIFIKDVSVLKISINCLIISIFLQPFDALWKILSGSLRALRHEKWVSFMSSVFNWVLYVPLSFFLGIHLNIGLIGIFWSQLFFKAVISIIYALKAKKAIKDLKLE